MARIAFTLGYQEKHKIVTNVSMWKGTDVWIDGKKVPEEEIRQSVHSPGSTFANLALSVGENERHEIKIEFGRWTWSGFSIQVDGREVYQWKPFKPKKEPYGYGISDYPTQSTEERAKALSGFR